MRDGVHGSDRDRSLAAALTLLLVACASCDVGRVEREEFVRAFVHSAFDGTEFHRQHWEAGHEYDVAAMRPRMSPEFEIIRWDRFGFVPGFGSYEYYLRFSNGARGVVYTRRVRGQHEAILVVY